MNFLFSKRSRLFRLLYDLQWRQYIRNPVREVDNLHKYAETPSSARADVTSPLTITHHYSLFLTFASFYYLHIHFSPFNSFELCIFAHQQSRYIFLASHFLKRRVHFLPARSEILARACKRQFHDSTHKSH